MLGNDIVDLACTRARAPARHARFDQRVLTPAEREALAASDAPERLRWVFWAAKEAAYKVSKKRDAQTLWAPSAFAVSLGAQPRVVHGAAGEFPLRIETGDGYIHALASDSAEGLRGALREIGRLRAGADEGAGAGESESAAVRRLAIAGLAPVLGVAPGALRVEQRDRIPLLHAHGAPARVDLSLSHHGRFIAWAAELEGRRA